MRPALQFLNAATCAMNPRRIQTHVLVAMMSLALPACNTPKEEHHEVAHKITATTPESKDVTLTQQYVCQIHSQRHIEIRALEKGYLEAITIREGQEVKEGELLFAIKPAIYKANLDAQNAEAKLAQLQFDFTQKLYEDKVVSKSEVALTDAKLAKAKAKAELAAAELGFTVVKAPFDGIVNHLVAQQGSLIREGEVLTTLSDNSVMWVYFNVPEKGYLEYMASQKEHQNELKIELMLASGNKFDQPGKINAIEADFNNQIGVIAFRADFPNPDRLLRHGQTGTVWISRVQKNSIIIPQRATFEVLQKRYVYVIDKDDIAHQREIVIQNELDDLYVIKSGVTVDDKIVLEGIRQVHDGQKVEYENRQAEQVDANLKYHAE